LKPSSREWIFSGTAQFGNLLCFHSQRGERLEAIKINDGKQDPKTMQPFTKLYVLHADNNNNNFIQLSNRSG